MRRLLCLALLFTVLGGPARRAFGEESREEPGVTAHYEIYGDKAAAERIAAELEERFAVYTRLFRFNPRSLAAPLRVRLIPDARDYDAYLAERLGEGRPGALYLHYSQAERRELVINYGGETGGPASAGNGAAEAWAEALPYQSFVQYLRSYIPSPPSWIEEGFAIYFSTLKVSPGGELSYEENLAWLEMVKAMKLPPGRELLLGESPAGLSTAERNALSWSLVSFFLNSGNEDYFRSLLECFMLLSPQAGAEENTRAAAERIGDWNGFDQLDQDYRAYLDSRKTFPELVNEGRRAYGEGDYRIAEQALAGARDLRPSHYAPYYYLGLIAYSEGQWDRAEQYFNHSLERGIDEALVCYALGLNAAAAGKGEEAAGFLGRAAAADPARYREKAAALLKRLPGR